MVCNCLLRKEPAAISFQDEFITVLTVTVCFRIDVSSVVGIKCMFFS